MGRKLENVQKYVSISQQRPTIENKDPNIPKVTTYSYFIPNEWQQKRPQFRDILDD